MDIKEILKTSPREKYSRYKDYIFVNPETFAVVEDRFHESGDSHRKQVDIERYKENQKLKEPINPQLNAKGEHKRLDSAFTKSQNIELLGLLGELSGQECKVLLCLMQLVEKGGRIQHKRKAITVKDIVSFTGISQAGVYRVINSFESKLIIKKHGGDWYMNPEIALRGRRSEKLTFMFGAYPYRKWNKTIREHGQEKLAK